MIVLPIPHQTKRYRQSRWSRYNRSNQIGRDRWRRFFGIGIRKKIRDDVTVAATDAAIAHRKYECLVAFAPGKDVVTGPAVEGVETVIAIEAVDTVIAIEGVVVCPPP